LKLVTLEPRGQVFLLAMFGIRRHCKQQAATHASEILTL
jgi:hypothetical protein